jgi:hypothetical protein
LNSISQNRQIGGQRQRDPKPSPATAMGCGGGYVIPRVLNDINEIVISGDRKRDNRFQTLGHAWVRADLGLSLVRTLERSRAMILRWLSKYVLLY